MLAGLGLATIVVLLLAILRKWTSPLVALILVPTLAALVGGFGSDIGLYIVDGTRAVAPMAAMFVFAILFFGMMTDAGLFQPIVDAILKIVGASPPRIVVGSVALAGVAHLDGSGATTFLVTIPALLPLYDRLGMDRRVLACAVAMAAGVNNMLPWGGPTIRAAAALNVDVMDVYGPLIPIHLIGLAFVFACAYFLGAREKKRLAPVDDGVVFHEIASNDNAPPEPWRFLVNMLITVGVIGGMISGMVHPVVAFMLGVVFAASFNFPDVDAQRQRVDAHAKTALMMASVLFAAGAFTGIMNGAGMLDAMAVTGAGLVPDAAASKLPVILGVLSMPLSLVFDPDSFYFGVLPVLAGIGEAAGATPLHVASGALMGQMTMGFPISPLTPTTFLLVGLAGIDLVSHQRFTIPYLFATSIVMTVAGVALGVLVN